MGSKHAGIHLRCDDSTEILAKLKKEFNKKKGPSKKDLAALEIIKAFANKNISAIADPAEKAEKEAVLSWVIDQGLKEMGAGDPAVIVVRKHFVSLYWYDHIRNENLRDEMLEYAHMCGVPAMGVGIYDDTNFSICAACDVGKPDARGCMGEYLFDYMDITPVKAEDICDMIDAPFLLEPLEKVLSADDGEAMATAFEEETGLPILMCAEECKASGMKELFRWASAVVYSADR